MIHSTFNVAWISLLLSTSGVTGFNLPGAPLHVDISTVSTRNSESQILGLTRSDARYSYAGTQLFYLNSNNGEQTSNGNDSSLSSSPRWLSSLLKPKSSSSSTTAPSDNDEDNSRQQVVDDYLEFLDKRYKKLHPKKEKKKNSSKNGTGFSALEWLRQPNTNNECNGNSVDDDTCITPEQQDDALYVLGVAGLASERLLQKHHLPVNSINKKRMDDGVVVDAMATEISTVMPSSSSGRASTLPVTELAVNFLKVGDTVLKRAQARRQALIDYQTRKAKSFLYVTLTSLSSVPQKAMNLWVIGGGKEMLALTASFLTAMVFVLKPLVQMIVREIATNNAPSSGSIHP